MSVLIVSKPLIWPLRDVDVQLPEELFTHICSYLPRSDIYNMRLVNKMFERMISPYLFKWVVVPFKAGIYGPEIDVDRLPDHNHSTKPGDMIKDEGMRVFLGYGERISKFAMSFEYDEQKVKYPPLKSDQEAITTFWGIYRWPHQQYNRFAQLAHLEQIADETKTLSAALKCITKATTLGLSIDSGLGWLSGPDINAIRKARSKAYKVFGGNRFAPEPLKRVTKIVKPASPVSNSEDMSRERMLRETGLDGEELQAAIDLMRETENPDVAETKLQSVGSRTISPQVLQTLEARSRKVGNQLLPTRRATITVGTSFPPSNGDMSTSPVSSSGDEAGLPSEDPLGSGSRPLSANAKKAKASDTWPLKPDNLTSSQKEVLLETMWAQQAFVQSYIISIADNGHVFSHVTTLTIARIPDHFLQDLARDKFWDSLCGLEEVNLAVIPSWRQVEKLATAYVQDTKVSPSQSIAAVYNLLDKQISGRKNIKSLQFEWIGGGEDAPGMFARNRHILAAPVVSTSMGMLDTTYAPIVLALPYIKNLTFINCWFSPHILQSFLDGFAEGKEHDMKLQTLVFDSVSLTAPIPTNTVPAPPVIIANPPAQAAPNMNAQGAPNLPPVPLAAAQAGLQVAGAVPQVAGAVPQAAGAAGAALSSEEDEDDVSEPSDTDKYRPRHSSWVDIIEQLTPSHYKSLSFRRQDARDPIIEPSRLNPPLISSLQVLEFQSCGYVQLPLDIDQSMIRATTIDRTRRLVQAAKSELKDAMLKPNDHTLGTIINQLNSIERWQLVNAYFLQMGWDDLAAYSNRFNESRLDGIRRPGQGRFTGTISIYDIQP